MEELFWVQQSEQQSEGKSMAADSCTAQLCRLLQQEPCQSRMEAGLRGDPAFSGCLKYVLCIFSLRKHEKDLTWQDRQF